MHANIILGDDAYECLPYALYILDMTEIPDRIQYNKTKIKHATGIVISVLFFHVPSFTMHISGGNELWVKIIYYLYILKKYQRNIGSKVVIKTNKRGDICITEDGRRLLFGKPFQDFGRGIHPVSMLLCEDQ
jgi:hypothetical protein